MATYENYLAFTSGVQHELMSYRSPSMPADTDLLPHHHDLLSQVYQALVQRNSSPNEALDCWNQVKPRLKSELEAAKSVMEHSAVDEIERLIDEEGVNIFVATAYHSAVDQAATHVEAPDAGAHKDKFESAEREFLEAEGLWENTTKVMSGGASAVTRIESIEDIVEIVKMPGSIEDKLEAAKKKSALGQLETVVDLVGKIQGATKSVLSVIGEIGERYCEGLARRAVAKGSKELAEELEKAAARWKDFGKAAKALAVGANIAALVGDGIALIDAARKGDWEGAVGATANIGVDAAPLVFGEGVAGPLAIVVVGAKVEMELLHEWAEIIRAINDEKVRKAAGDFVAAMTKNVYPWAVKLISNAEVMLDASLAAEVQQAAQAQVASDAKMTWQTVKWAIQTFLGPLEQYDDVYNSLGGDAIAALDVNSFVMPVEMGGGILIPQQVIERVQKIFHGTNLMGAYVRDHYKHGE
jgi:hypothetical protein